MREGKVALRVWDWIGVCLNIGALSFGGAGRALLYRDAVVTERGWISEEEFQEIYTVSSILPGPNLINLAAYIGYKLFGMFGGVAGVVMLSAPGAIMALLVIWFIPIHNAYVSLLFQGFSIGSIALFTVMIVQLFTGLRSHHIPGPVCRTKLALRLVMTALVVMMGFLNVPFVVMLLGGLLLCLIVEFLL